ncbi:MAG: DEAD/DEAH box helicase family protein, partial [Candidatus Acidiferrales bacterium]
MLLSGVAEQSAFYAGQLPPFLQAQAKLRFFYESTGVETLFRDTRDPEARSRNVFAFHKPETLAKWLTEAGTLRARLRKLPPLITTGMRDCQIEAVTRLEQSLAQDKPRALMQTATGAGKTYTACAFTYRLIKHANARRVLFVVDRDNLGKQTKGEFDQYNLPDTNRKFTETYNIQRLQSSHFDWTDSNAPTPGMPRNRSSLVRQTSEARRHRVRSVSISAMRLSSQAICA